MRLLHRRYKLNEIKFLSMLGLSRRAGAVIIGTDLVTKSLPSKNVKVVFYTADSSANTEKRITDKCKFYGVECVKIDTPSAKIGKALGKEAGVCVLGITNDSFSSQLKILASSEMQ